MRSPEEADEVNERPPAWFVDPRALLATGRQRVRRRRFALLAITVASVLTAAVILAGVARALG